MTACVVPPDVLHDLVLARAYLHHTDTGGVQEWWAEHGGRQQLLLLLSPDGAQCWYRDGQLHRGGDRPTYVEADGTQEWWVDGQKVR